MENKKPAHEIREGSLKATLWVNREGDEAFYSVNLERLYKTDGGWRKSHCFGARSLERVIALLSKVQEWIAQHPANQ